MKLDKEDIDSYYQRQFFNEPKSPKINGTTIFFAVVAAIIFCWFLKGMYEEWQIRRAIAILNEQIAVTEARNEQRIRLRAEQNQLLRIQKHKAELEQQVVFEAQMAAKNAKEVARKAFYKPVSGCESDNPNRELIKCGNDYARANKQFEENWAKSN